MDIKTRCAELRAAILITETQLRELKAQLPSVPFSPTSDVANRPEMIANATLAYRHLEDARMRIGKVIQAFDGGASCYKS